MSSFVRDMSVVITASAIVLGAVAAASEYLPSGVQTEHVPLEPSQAAHLSANEIPEFSAPHPGKYGTTNGMWAFGKVTDRMRGETISEAYAMSRSNGGDELLLRFQRKGERTYRAALELRRGYGYALCGDACEIPISVDGKMTTLVARNASPGATELEVYDAAGFDTLLKRTRTLFVELQLDDGAKQYEFRTEGLDWSAARDAEPMFTN